MYQESPQYISIGKAAKLLGVCTNTLLNWEDSGIVTPFKTDGGHRRYNRDDILMLRAGLLRLFDAITLQEAERVVLIDENLLCIGNELVSQICHNLGVAIEVVPKEFSKGIPDYQAQDSLSFMVNALFSFNLIKVPPSIDEL